MENKKLKCWHKIQKILNNYGYSYMDMLDFLHLIDISRMKRDFDLYIKQIIKRKININYWEELTLNFYYQFNKDIYRNQIVELYKIYEELENGR